MNPVRIRAKDLWKPRLKTKQRILIADEDGIFARRLATYFWDLGFEAKVVQTIAEAKELVDFWRPDTIFVDLFIRESNALSLLKFLAKRQRADYAPRVVVMSRQTNPMSVIQMRRAGAAEYLVKPFSMEDALAAVRVVPEANEPAAPKEVSPLHELHLIELFLKQAQQPQGWHKLMCMMSLKTRALRTSLIECLDANQAQVVASNDNQNIGGHRLDLTQYPEIQEVRRTGRPLIIQDVRNSDLLEPVKDLLMQTPYETLMIFPVLRRGQFFGVMSLRLTQRNAAELPYLQKFGQVCAQIISLSLGS